MTSRRKRRKKLWKVKNKNQSYSKHKVPPSTTEVYKKNDLTRKEKVKKEIIITN